MLVVAYRQPTSSGKELHPTDFSRQGVSRATFALITRRPDPRRGRRESALSLKPAVDPSLNDADPMQVNALSEISLVENGQEPTRRACVDLIKAV